MANIYRRSYQLFIANSILFSHESPLRGERFVTRKIAQGVAKIKLGLAKTISLGNIESQRDWGFAGDYVEAMWLMLQHPQADDFVLSTGQVHSIREFLAVAFAAVGISDWQPYITIDPKFYRPIDLNTLYGSNSKAKQELGWQPLCSFEQLVGMMVAADLKRLQKP
jgi:GDPmannose 4,6-dehydratase